MECQLCGKKIKPKVFWQKFCSNKCRRNAHALKEANKALKGRK